MPGLRVHESLLAGLHQELSSRLDIVTVEVEQTLAGQPKIRPGLRSGLRNRIPCILSSLDLES